MMLHDRSRKGNTVVLHRPPVPRPPSVLSPERSGPRGVCVCVRARASHAPRDMPSACAFAPHLGALYVSWGWGTNTPARVPAP